MRLLKNELYKLWRNNTFLLCLAILLLANTLLLWFHNQAENDKIPSEAYRSTYTLFRYMSEDEKYAFLTTQCDTLLAVLQIDNLVQAAALNGDDPRIGHEELFDEYGEIYSRRIYPYHTTTLSNEYSFYANLLAECETVANYNKFLSALQTKAQQLASISIFNTENSGYEQANITATASAYANIPIDFGENLCYTPQIGLQTALSYPYTDLFLLFGMLVISSVSVRNERDSSLLILIRSTAKGRLVTALYKLCAMAISVFVLTLLLYGNNLIYCSAMYGLPALSIPIQSVPFLMRSTHLLSVGDYLLLFLVTKWLAAVAIGVWVLLASLFCRRPMASYLLALVLPVTQVGIRQSIPATSRLNTLKYANLISLLQTNELLGNYRNLYWFGKPVSLPSIELLSALLFLAFLIPAFLISFSRITIPSSLTRENSSIRLKKNIYHALRRHKIIHRQKHSTTLIKEEARKLFVFQGASVILIILLIVSIVQTLKEETYRSIEDMYYQYYMKNLSGAFDIDAYQWLAHEDQFLQPLYEADRAFASGTLTADQRALIYTTNYDLNQRKIIQEKLFSNNFNWLKTHKDAQLVYETPYYKLFDLDDTVDKQASLLMTLATVLCCSGIFAYEKKGKMDRILRTTPLGQKRTVSIKIMWGVVIGTLTAIIVSLPKLIKLAVQYGFYALTAPALSLQRYESVATVFTLSDLVVLWLLLRILAGISTALLTMTLSQWNGNSMLSILFASLSLGLPLLLSQSGMLHIKWISFYPLYHWAAILASGEGPMVLWVYPLVAFLICVACIRYLLDSYREEV